MANRSPSKSIKSSQNAPGLESEGKGAALGTPNSPNSASTPQRRNKDAKFALPMEPTESLDKNREYPPIITADGRVDTDIDHLVENPDDDEDIGDLNVQELPSKFPKPRVVRVIDGSLDDDIDNLMNHDGTMAHTLVDAPKHFNKGDLKDVNSKKAQKKSSMESQPSRSFRRMGHDQIEEDFNFTGVDIVPHGEKNNSSNDMLQTMMHGTEYIEHTNGDEQDIVSLVSNDKEEYSSSMPEHDSGQNNVEETGQDNDIEEKQEIFVDLEDREILEKVLSHLSVLEKENDSGVGISPHATFENTLAKINSMFAEKTTPSSSQNEGLERALPCQEDSQSKIIYVNNSDNVVENACATASSHSLDAVNNSVCDTSLHFSYKDQSCNKVVKNEKSSEDSNPSLLESIEILKKALETISSTSTAYESQTDSQRALTVTALKVAGDSMTAAAKMADALTLLVKTSRPDLASSLSLNQAQQPTLPEQKPPTICSTENSCPKITPKSQTTVNDNIIEQSEMSKSEDNPNRLKKDAEIDKASQIKSVDDKRNVDNGEDDEEHSGKRKRDRKSLSRHRKEKNEDHRKESSEHRRNDSGEQNRKEGSEHHRKSSTRDDSQRHSPKANGNELEEEKPVDKSEELSKKSRRKSKDKKRSESHHKRKQEKQENGEKERNDEENTEMLICSQPTELKDEVRKTEEDYPECEEVGKRRSSRSEKDPNRKSGSHKDREKRHKSASSKRQVLDVDINESHSPDIFKSKASEPSYKRSFSRNSTHSSQRDLFLGSEPWKMPQEESACNDRYFDEVARRLKPYSPPKRPPMYNPYKDYIRAKLVGTGVDPFDRDSDFDSIEFNGNARMSSSRLVHFDTEYDSIVEENSDSLEFITTVKADRHIYPPVTVDRHIYQRQR